MKIETKCLHAGYTPKNGEPRALPIYQSTTFKFDSTEFIGDLFDFNESAHFYSRLSNPTVDAVEQKLAALEGGIGAMLTSSGQAATTISLLNILKSGDHFVSSSCIYGGTFNLFAITFKKLGIDVTFVDPDLSLEELQKYIRPNTKAVFGETISNPTINVLDIEKFVKLAHDNNVPFIIDNTFATPILCRPIEYGADIVVHSTTKYLDGHAIQVGGAIIDSGNFDWKKNGFADLYEPDESYHGLIYTDTFGKAAYISKAEDALKRLKNGEDVNKLAKELSEDPGKETNPEGYVFTYGEMVPEFEEAVTSMEVGGISDIIEISFGYHVIKRLPLSAAKDSESFENNKSSIESEIIMNYLENVIPTWKEEMTIIENKAPVNKIKL